MYSYSLLVAKCGCPLMHTAVCVFLFALSAVYGNHCGFMVLK